jgi:hypothetical protein
MLTRDALRTEGVWPAPDRSTLAAGMPLELSVGGRPALRFTAEVADPRADPVTRLRSGLAAVRRTADLLGAMEAYQRARPALDVLADQTLVVPDGCPFWLWAGVDLAPGGGAVLKAYLSLHAGDVPGWRDRERAFLRRCGVPPGSAAHAVLARLAEDGWCQEAGVGLAPSGAWGVKIYYELDGYRPRLVEDVLALAGLDPDPAGMAPEIPGVLRASLAAKSRGGVAVRVDPATGRVDEVTVIGLLPPPLAGRDVVAARVQEWLDAGGPAGAGDAHARVVAALLPRWVGAPAAARMHSLFTRSRRRSRSGDFVDGRKVYVRPFPAPVRGAR